MIRLPFLAHSTVAVVGLGKSGTATARALSASGARVLVWDDNAAARATAVAEGLSLADPDDLSGVDLVLWSPGIPHTHPKPHPLAERARAAGLPLICDVELLGRACPAAGALAITGTNGKSTTTSLLGHILQEAGRPVQVGGNLGIPALDLAPLDADGAYVLELSSYQLELIDRIRFDVAVLLNITPDHLARHGGMDGYIAAKRRLFDHVKPGGTAVIGVDDEPCRTMAASLSGRVVPISAERAVAGGVYMLDGVLIDDMTGAARPVMDLKPVTSLPGRHNGQNAAAAYAAARAAGVPEDQVCAAIRSFPGLAHRQQRVGDVGGVLYVNDSKATNADAVEKALACYDAIYWILGGQAKEGGIEPLAPQFGRIRHAFLIGEAAPSFARTLDGKVPYSQCGTLDVAVREAAALAEPGSVVLLSPACASWDQFKDFEHRGDTFRRLVEALAGER
jgi:UDP-N-acetylmuramoylalanine--D-glutamate ligase